MERGWVLGASASASLSALSKDPYREPRVLPSTPARPVSLVPGSDTCQRWPRPRSRSAGSPPGAAQQCQWVTTRHDLLTLSCILSLMG